MEQTGNDRSGGPGRRSRVFPVLPLMLSLAIWLTASACSFTTHCLNGETPAEVRPTREIAAVLVVDDAADGEEVRDILEKACGIFYEQTGIELTVKDTLTIEWAPGTRDEMLGQLIDAMKTYPKPFDMAIAFYDMDPAEALVFNMFGGWTGAIDDEYRRYVVLRRDNPQVLVHELGHAFLFRHVHTGEAMSAYTICVVGDHLCANKTVCFSEEDRKEIARNKWRDFSVAPDISERQDLIHGYAYSRTWLGLLWDTITYPFRMFGSRTPPKKEQKARFLSPPRHYEATVMSALPSENFFYP